MVTRGSSRSGAFIAERSSLRDKRCQEGHRMVAAQGIGVKDEKGVTGDETIPGCRVYLRAEQQAGFTARV